MTVSTGNRQGLISSGNSTTTPLSGGGTFTGTGELNFYPDVLVSCKTDVSGTLFFDFSTDGTNWDSVFPPNGFRVSAGINEFHTAVKGARHFRVRFVNDATAQSYLRLQTQYGSFRQGNLPIRTKIAEDADSTVVRQVGEEEYGLSRVDGAYLVQKFGKNPDVDAAEDIWDGGGDYTGFPTSTAETIEAVSSSTNDTVAGTGARTLRIFYFNDDYEMFDANGDPLFVDITLNGTTPVSTGVTGMRVWRARVLTSGSGQTNAGDITVRWATTTSVIFTVVQAGEGTSKITAFTVPSGYTGYLKRYNASMLDNTANDGLIAFKSRAFGSNTFILSRDFAINTDGVAPDRRPYGGFQYPEKTDGVFRCTQVSNINATITAEWDMILVRNI